MTTKAQVLKAARAKYGKGVHAELRPDAVTGERREEIKSRVAELKEQIDGLRAARRKLLATRRGKTHVYGELLRAARFVIDVDGDETALEQMRPLVVEAETLEQLQDDEQYLERERRKLAGRLHRDRCWVGQVDYAAGIGLDFQLARGDNWAECLEQIRRGKR